MRSVLLASLGAALSLGAPPATNHGGRAFSATPATEQVSQAVSESRVDFWVKDWQRRLSLTDWRITAQIVRASDLRPDTLGNLKWNSDTRTATIRVLSPLDYDLPASEIPTDIEYTVVHELIHLQLALLPHEQGPRILEEKAVNRIAEALFSLEKGSAYRSRLEVTRATSKTRAASESSRSSKP